MPAVRSFLSKGAPSWLRGSSAQSSYLGRGANSGHRKNSDKKYTIKRSDGIMKSFEVEMYRTERSGSDVELVDGLPQQVPNKVYGA